MSQIPKERFSAFRELRGYTQKQIADILGVTAKYVGMIERGEKIVDDAGSLGLLFRHYEGKDGNLGGVESAGLARNASNNGVVLPGPEIASRAGAWKVPLVGWAHAGQAEAYEEIPKDWQDTMATDCRDTKAFAVTLEGDSMEPLYKEGDALVLMPGEEIHNGCLAVVKFVDDGVIFRRVETRSGKMRLVPLNPRYESEEHQMSEIAWAYPVWEQRRKVWRG